MAKRVEVCHDCEEMYQIDYITGEVECPLCNADYQDYHPVEFVDGNLLHINKQGEEHNDYYDDYEEMHLPEIEDVDDGDNQSPFD